MNFSGGQKHIDDLSFESIVRFIYSKANSVVIKYFQFYVMRDIR